jgi:hypothetical protein
MKTKYELLDSAMYLYPSHAPKTLKYKKVSVRLIILLAILGGVLCYTHYRTYQRDFRSRVREMTKHAWDGYYKYARDSAELRPVTHAGYNWTALPLYINAVDSLDTLFLMGLTKEYEQAKEIVRTKLHFDHLDFQINIFETNIRILGGLLGAYELDADPLFIEKAVQLADRILPAFDTKSGIPVVEYNLATGEMGSQIVNIASVGTLQLELQYLSDITGNPEYQDKALYALEQLMNLPKDIPGLFPQLVNVEKMKFETPLMYTIGAGSDSFYEYLLKLYLSTGNEKFKNWFVSSSTVSKISFRQLKSI